MIPPLSAWTLGGALAVAAPLDSAELPAIAADPNRPIFDGGAPYYVANTSFDDIFGANASLSVVQDPLLVVVGDARLAVVSELVALDLSAWRTFGGWARIGVRAPVFLVSNGDLSGVRGPTAGDPGLELKLRLLQRGSLGLALLGGMTASLGASALQLGDAGPTWHAGLAAGLTGERGALLVNVETRGVPGISLGAQQIDDGLVLRGAGVYTPTSPLALSAELMGTLPWRGLETAPGGLSSELVLGARWQDPRGHRLGLALGRGLSEGVGSPALRVVLSVGW